MQVIFFVHQGQVNLFVKHFLSYIYSINDINKYVAAVEMHESRQHRQNLVVAVMGAGMGVGMGAGMGVVRVTGIRVVIHADLVGLMVC